MKNRVPGIGGLFFKTTDPNKTKEWYKKKMDKKYNGSTLHDIGHHTKNNISTIADFKNSLMS